MVAEQERNKAERRNTRCGQSNEQADFLALKPGSFVTIEAQREDEVPPNWSPDMAYYVGQTTQVVDVLGVDEQGCPGVRVEADSEVFFWRVRDLQPMPAPAEFSQRCGQSELRPDFLGLEPGVSVRIAEVRDWHGDVNWVEAMDAFVGEKAKVVRRVGVDNAGCPGVELDVDEGSFFWRVRDLERVTP